MRPGDAVLSEEGADDPVRLHSERVWIVDPLDGTREFSEAGRDDSAVPVRRPSRSGCAMPSAGSCSRWYRRGAKVAAVVTGRAEIYVHAGGQYEWDSAAPVAVARTAGLYASGIDGSALCATTRPTRRCPTCWCASRGMPKRHFPRCCDTAPGDHRNLAGAPGASQMEMPSAQVRHAVTDFRRLRRW